MYPFHLWPKPKSFVSFPRESQGAQSFFILSVFISTKWSKLHEYGFSICIFGCMYHDYRQRYPRRKLFQQKEANYTRLVGRNSSLYTRFLHSLLILTGLQSGPRVSLHLSPSTDIWDTVKIPLEATVNNRTWCFSRNKFYRGGPPLYRWIPHLTPSLPSLSLLDRTVLGRGPPPENLFLFSFTTFAST